MDEDATNVHDDARWIRKYPVSAGNVWNILGVTGSASKLPYSPLFRPSLLKPPPSPSMSSSMLSRRALASVSRLRTFSRANSTSTNVAPPVQKVADAIASSDPHTKQAPNAPAVWSTSQAPRPHSHSNARFEQTLNELQPNPLSAQAMIAEEPVRLVHGRKAACDGGQLQLLCYCLTTYVLNVILAGGGPLGHPKVYINLDQPGPRPCGYASSRPYPRMHSDTNICVYPKATAASDTSRSHTTVMSTRAQHVDLTCNTLFEPLVICVSFHLAEDSNRRHELCVRKTCSSHQIPTQPRSSRECGKAASFLAPDTTLSNAQLLDLRRLFDV
jgi:NADH dehydrogenase (ubiquinone) Fe-S protein 6